jgi:uncharacterized protein (DUF2141 family)
MKDLAKTIIIAILFGIISNVSFAQSKFSVTVVIKGIKTRQGNIRASITNDANSFPQGGGMKSAVAEVTKEGEITLKFEGMMEGKYGIMLFQDLNDNNIMDMKGQMPAEPFGFSNISMLMGPPTFEQCAFELNENKTIEIGLISF